MKWLWICGFCIVPAIATLVVCCFMAGADKKRKAEEELAKRLRRDYNG